MEGTRTPPRVQLIINADDFGHCQGRNKGIVECYRNNVVSSASLIVNGRETIDAVRQARLYDIPLGLHLNLTEGEAINRGRCDSLLDSTTGLLGGKFGFREALACGAVDKNELRGEIKAQFDYFKELTGSTPSHVNGHQHVHVLPGVYEIFSDVARDCGVNAVRLPVQHGLGNWSWHDEISQTFHRCLMEDAVQAEDFFTKSGFRIPDGFMGLNTMGRSMTLPTLKAALETALRTAAADTRSHNPGRLPTVELMVHPGYPCQVGCGPVGEEFFCLEERTHEMRVLGSVKWRDLMAKAGVKLISFESLR